MTELGIVVVAGAITFGSRAAFMLRPPRSLPPAVNRFLRLFPLTLFMSLGVRGLVRPSLVEGEAALPALLAVVGLGLVGKLTKRSLIGMLIGGTAGYWIGVLLLAT